jgi:protein-tyrosine phosphatase
MAAMQVGQIIDWLEHPAFPGRVGLTHCPGRRVGSTGGELAQIQASGASVLVTLVQDEELEELGLAGLGELVRRAGMVWHHLPIIDFGTPDAAFEDRWAEIGDDIRRRLAAGETVVVHCFAGLGRTGMVAARILVEHGEPPDAAIRRVRQARAGAIQSKAQEQWVLALGEGRGASVREGA